MRNPGKILPFLHKGLHGIRTLLYPSHCGACGIRVEVSSGEELLCQPCREKILRPSGHLCPICSHPVSELALCSNCEGRDWHLKFIVAACRYEGLVRELIQRFKYGRDLSLVRLLGELMLPAMEDPRFDGKKFDAIVPVPLHPMREREREFNQAALLALRLGGHLGIPVLQLLSRNRVTKPQAGFDRNHRLENLKGAFSVRRGVKQGAVLLLVDDVSTTGTTLDLCAAVLLDAGAGEVCAVTVARG